MKLLGCHGTNGIYPTFIVYRHGFHGTSHIIVFVVTNLTGNFFGFHRIGPLGRFDLVVAMSVVCIFLYLFVPFPCDIFRGLSLALRSHDQIPASHWSTLLPYHMVVVGGGGGALWAI